MEKYVYIVFMCFWMAIAIILYFSLKRQEHKKLKKSDSLEKSDSLIRPIIFDTDLLCKKITDVLHDRIVFDKFNDNIDKSRPLVEQIIGDVIIDKQFTVTLNTNRKISLILIKYASASSAVVYWLRSLEINVTNNNENFKLYPFDFSPSAVAFEFNDYIKKDFKLELFLYSNALAKIFFYPFKENDKC
jgi:hypothetical protein